jgi:hypothetical protein
MMMRMMNSMLPSREGEARTLRGEAWRFAFDREHSLSVMYKIVGIAFEV